MTKLKISLPRIAMRSAALAVVLLAGPALAQTPDAGATLPDISATLPRDLSPWGMFLHADMIGRSPRG